MQEDKILFEFKNSVCTLSEIKLRVDQYKNENPGMDVVVDGDRHAIVARRRAHV